MEGVGEDCAFLEAMNCELQRSESSQPFEDLGDYSGKTLAEVLAAHVNRYIQFPETRNGAGEEEEFFVSFQDFIEQPRVRFLSQVHRVEAYMWFLYGRTKKEWRLRNDVGDDKPLGVPVARSFTCDYQNVHCATGPGDCLKAQLLEEGKRAASGSVEISPALDVDPGQGDAVTHIREIVEHRALKGDELNWETIFIGWGKSGSDLTPGALDHVLVHSPSRLSILLSLAPQAHIVNLQLSHEAMRAIMRDFKAASPLLRMCSSSKDLQTRVAAIWWLLLLRADPSDAIADVEGDTVAQDHELLNECGIVIELHASDEILLSTARTLMQMDNPHVLKNQQALKDFILDDKNAQTVLILLNDGTRLPRLGCAFVSAMCAAETFGAILNEEKGMAVLEKLGSVLRWMSAKSSSSVKAEDIRDNIQNLVPNLSPAAVSLLLESSCMTKNEAFIKARDGLILPYLQKMHQSSQIFEIDQAGLLLRDILGPICKGEKTKGMAVRLIEVIASTEDEAFKEGPTSRLPDTLEGLGPVWEALYVACRKQTVELCWNLFDEMLHTSPIFQLPFEDGSELLCKLYVLSLFHEVEGRERTGTIRIGEELNMHSQILSSSGAKDAMFKAIDRHLSHTGQFMGLDLGDKQAPARASILALLWYTWWSKPFQAIRHLPDHETWNVFKSVVGKVKPSEELAYQGLSTLARFAIAPHTLPASVLIALKKSIIGGEQIIIPSTRVLAQKGSPDFPTYSFRVHLRPLPSQCIDYIVSAVRAMEFKDPEGGAASGPEKLRMLFPITNMGISPELAHHNLNILVHLDALKNLYGERAAGNQYHVALVIVSWFFAAGIQEERMYEMCKHKTKVVRNYVATMRQQSQMPHFVSNNVFVPLPVDVDVRFLTESDKTPLFLTTEESAGTTSQLLQSIVMFYELTEELNTADQYRKYAEDLRAGTVAGNDEPKRLIREMMLKAVNIIVKRRQEIHGDMWQTTVLENLVPLADFLAQLSRSNDLRTGHGPKDLPMYSKCAIEAIAEGLKDVDEDLQLCVSDGLYMLVGVTPENHGAEVIYMVEMWCGQGLKISATAFAEMEWMAENVYKEKAPVLSEALLQCCKMCKTDHTARPYRRSFESNDEPLCTFTTTAAHFHEVYSELLGERSVISCVPGSIQQQKHHSPSAANTRSQSQHSRIDDFVRFTEPSGGNSIVRTSSGSKHKVPVLGGTGEGLPAKTISARKLLSLDARTGFGVVSVIPGLHPVMWSPGDWRKIPVAQQKSLVHKHTFDKSEIDPGDCVIEEIFSNNGGTWERLDRLPPGSTLMGQGFYLRKSNQGSWMLMLGAASEKMVESPSFLLWDLLDTVKLAAFGFDPAVLDYLCAIVCLAAQALPEMALPEADSRMKVQRESVLSNIRKLASQPERFVHYLLREGIVCNHVFSLLTSIREKRQKNRTVRDALRSIRDRARNIQTVDDTLEEMLLVADTSNKRWMDELCVTLKRFLGVCDPDPRSQLIHTLKLIPHNQRILADEALKLCRVEVRNFADHVKRTYDDDSEPEDDEVEGLGKQAGARGEIGEEEHLAKLLKTFFVGDKEDKEDVNNVLVVRHEHITQEKFRERSRRYISKMEEGADCMHEGTFEVVFPDSDDEQLDEGGFRNPADRTGDHYESYKDAARGLKRTTTRRERMQPASCIVLQDTNLVSYILSLILESLDLTVLERLHRAHLHGSSAPCRWYLRGCKLGMMLQINTTWYLLLCRNTTSRFRVRSLTVLCGCDPWHGQPRPNTDPYDRAVRTAMSVAPWSPDALLGELHFLQPLTSLSVPSLGNHFCFSRCELDQAFTCMDRALPALASVHTLDVQSLNGLMTLPRGISDDRRPLPSSVRCLRVHSVGHAGLLHCEVIKRLFRDAQERAITCVSSRDVHRGGMADLGGIEELHLLAPLCARVQLVALTDRLDFNFPRQRTIVGGGGGGVLSQRMMCTEDASTVEEADTSMHMVAQAVLQRRISKRDMAAVPPQSMPMAGGLELHASLGNLYLGSLDLHGVRRVRLRAYACMGVPHCLTGTSMDLRRQELRYHSDMAVNAMIAKEGELVLPHLLPWRERNDPFLDAESWAEPLLRFVYGSYFPGIMSIVSMVSRSTTLEEVVYTGVRSELVNDVVVRELLVQPWRLMVEKRAEDTGGGPKPKLRVYVEGVQWSLGPPAPINKSNESSALQSGTPMERLLIYSI